MRLIENRIVLRAGANLRIKNFIGRVGGDKRGRGWGIWLKMRFNAKPQREIIFLGGKYWMPDLIHVVCCWGMEMFETWMKYWVGKQKKT